MEPDQSSPLNSNKRLIYYMIISTLILLTFFFVPKSYGKTQREFIDHPSDISSKVEFYWQTPERGKNWPVMLLLHGHQWPKKPGGKQFVDWGVLDSLSQKGYMAVAVSQPGYGESSGPSDFCGPFTQNAVLSVIERVRKISRGKIFVQGISRGAVVASMLPFNDKNLDGLILIAGAYDLKSLYLDKPDSPISLQVKAEMKISDENFKSRSVLLNPRKLSIPALILHGKKDEKAPVNQAIKLAARLKVESASSEIHLFDSGHMVPYKIRQPIIEAFLKKLNNL